MPWINLFVRPVDAVCTTVNETLKATVQEVWRLSSQLATGTSVVLLGFLHKPGFVNHLEHRNRIKKIRAISPGGEKKRRTPFAELCEDGADSGNSSDEGSKQTEGIAPITYEIERRGVDASSQSFLTMPQAINDLAHYHEQITTGLVEDIFTNGMLLIDRYINRARMAVNSTIEAIASARFASLVWVLLFLFSILNPIANIRRLIQLFRFLGRVKRVPQKLISVEQLDVRSVSEIIIQAGYPYEQYSVTTEDGYILKLERIPNPNSKHVLYLQHGIFDCSFAWVGSGAGALAFHAHDQGYDVFLGNFRGNGDRLHVRKDISSNEYWDFSINEHAFLDIPAFIGEINKTKTKELHTEGEENPFKISVISHSMGAAATLMYMVHSRIFKRQHHLTQAILLSPAGYHKTAPLICDIMGPIINVFLKIRPSFHVFRFPSDTFRILAAKATHDMMNSGAIKDLVAYLASRFVLGGEIADHPLTKVHNLAYNTFTGTAVKIYKHFWQLYRSGKFQAYNYGAQKNKLVYGSATPINFLENFDKIDIPTHFCFGLHDNLIHPENVIHQYATLRKHHPDLAFLKATRHGHLEFTLGLDESVLVYIMDALKREQANSS